MVTHRRHLAPPSIRGGHPAGAASPLGPKEAWRFGTFELHPGERRLLDRGAPVVLGSRPFDLLVALVSHAGELVAKDLLLDLVWPGVVVEESNLQVQVSAVRKVIGQDAIRTVSGHGYRFELPVEKLAPPAANRDVAIPQPLSTLVGREAEIESVRSLLESNRLVTLKGAGGIGKTRLALGVGHGLARAGPGSIWFVDLSAQHDGAALPAAILASIGASGDAQNSGIEALQQRLRENAAVLILDNCEQIIEAVAATCRRLLENCPGLKLLCTSREPLRISGEAVFTVPPLSEVESRALFIARARAVSPSLRDSPETRPLVDVIVRRLDGISLALELAAARLRGMSLRELATQIDDRFQVLTGGDRTALPRHQALRATMEWSYQLLSRPERQLFRRLAVFNGPFGLGDVAAVAADEVSGRVRVLDLLTALVDKSLVQADPDSHEEGYSLFESTRAFANDELAREGELERVLERHFDYYFGRVCAARDSHDTGEWTARRDGLRSAYANVTAALRWALVEEHDLERGADMAAGMLYFWSDLGLFEEADRWLSLARRHLPSLTPYTAAGVLHALGGVCAYLDAARIRESEKYLEESIRIYSTLDDCRHEWAIACNQLGVTRIYRMDYQGARAMFENALPVYRATGNRQREGQALHNLAALHLHLDDAGLAEPMFREAMEVAREAGNIQTEATCLGWLAECAFVRGAPAESLVLARRALALREDLPGSPVVATILYRTARYAAEVGDFPLARRSMLESLRVISLTRASLVVVECFDECARLSIVARRPGDGARMQGFVAAWRDSESGRPRAPKREREARTVTATLRELLGAKAYDRQFELGRHLALDDAFALAQSIAESLAEESVTSRP